MKSFSTIIAIAAVCLASQASAFDVRGFSEAGVYQRNEATIGNTEKLKETGASIGVGYDVELLPKGLFSLQALAGVEFLLGGGDTSGLGATGRLAPGVRICTDGCNGAEPTTVTAQVGVGGRWQNRLTEYGSRTSSNLAVSPAVAIDWLQDGSRVKVIGGVLLPFAATVKAKAESGGETSSIKPEGELGFFAEARLQPASMKDLEFGVYFKRESWSGETSSSSFWSGQGDLEINSLGLSMALSF